MFYLLNYLHDITYHYGFTEETGNFQNTNLDHPGEGNDAIEVVCQSSEGKDNAYMMSPPDGQAGYMAMFLFDVTTPDRDGSLESTIPMHEFFHGVSNRLTGGPNQAHCLQKRESGGMGEGWSDAFAIFLTRNSKNNREENITIGSYVFNSTAGLRNYPYSTHLEINPLMFHSLNELYEPHDVGELWAMLMIEMYWNLVDKHGFSDNWKDSKQSQGNIVALQLMIGGDNNYNSN